jgi:hypothetical protein
MRLLFLKSCACENTEHNALPIPRFHTKAPQAKCPEAIVDIELSCPTCGAQWLCGITPGAAIEIPEKATHVRTKTRSISLLGRHP